MKALPNNLAFFSLAGIALALGRSKTGVRKALAEIRPGGLVEVRGHMAQGWSLLQLPERLRLDLRKVAISRGYKNEAHLLQDPPKRWQPPFPLSEVAEHHLTRATRLRGALARALAAQDQAEWERGLCAICLQEFRKEFGMVSERHFRRLIKRTIERDAAEENFDDLAIYLDENVTRKPRESLNPSDVSDADALIFDCLSSIKNRTAPTVWESDRTWTVICESIQARLDNGEEEKRARAGVVSLLIASGVNLSENSAALKKQVKRKFQAWATNGQSITSISDKRGKKSGHYRKPEFSDDSRKTLIALASAKFGGRVAPAWKFTMDHQLIDEEVSGHYISNPGRKSYVPQTVRGEIAPDVKRLHDIKRGPRQHKLQGPHITRDWSGVASGDWYSSDDVTLPVYFYTETERGVEVMRGQFLLFTDVRTSYILGYVLILGRNYNSRAIRSLITACCTRHGLPRKGFQFERGIWKSSHILTGKNKAADVDTWEVADRGLRALGLTFKHALLPRGKSIENLIGRFQNQTEDLPGYCGRNEASDVFERFQKNKRAVEAGREPADKYFLNEKEICAEYDRIIDDLNNTPQEGRMLGGLSPKEGWKTLQSTPRTLLDATCLHLLAHDCRKMKVGANGITIQIGKERFNYKGAETGRRQGEFVYAWFNPQRDDLLTCTDLNMENPFTVERSFAIPAMDASSEDLDAENEKIAAHSAYAKELFKVTRNVLPAAHFRANLVDRKTANLGEAIREQRKEISTRQEKTDQLRTDIDRRAASMGVPRAHMADTPETADFLATLQAVTATLSEDER